MKKAQITWMEIALLIPASAALLSPFGMPVEAGATLGLLLVILTLVVMDLLNKRTAAPSRQDYLIALTIVRRAEQRGAIDRLAALKGEMFILRELAIQTKVFGTVRRGVRVPAGWDMVEA